MKQQQQQHFLTFGEGPQFDRIHSLENFFVTIFKTLFKTEQFIIIYHLTVSMDVILVEVQIN